MNRNRYIKTAQRAAIARAINAGESITIATHGCFAHRDKATGVIAYYSAQLLDCMSKTAAMCLGAPGDGTRAGRRAIVEASRSLRLLAKRPHLPA